MLDHVSIGVRDIARARAFYDRALEPIGYRRLSDARTRSATARRPWASGSG